MRIQVYANSTLGGDRDLLETCADGDIPFVVQNTAPQVSFMKDLAVFDLPCVFDSLDDCRKKLDDPDFYNLISQVYTDGGYHLLGMAAVSYTHLDVYKRQMVHSAPRGAKYSTTSRPTEPPPTTTTFLPFQKSSGYSPAFTF